jgi:hypothetical protein
MWKKLPRKMPPPSREPVTTPSPTPRYFGLPMRYPMRKKNEVFFFDDIYGYDKQLDEALRKGYPYPTA